MQAERPGRYLGVLEILGFKDLRFGVSGFLGFRVTHTLSMRNRSEPRLGFRIWSGNRGPGAREARS